MADILAVLNTIRANASPTYQERIPTATAANITEISSPLLTYSTLMNEFLTTLVNRIGLVLVRNKELHNPLSILKQGENPLGQDIEELFTNPAQAEKYNPKSTDLLAQSPPDVKALYHRMNRQDRYTVTISHAQMKAAFTSYEALEKLINSIVNSLYSGNYLDEYLLAKETLATAISGNKIIPVNVGNITDAQAAKDFATAARTIFTNFGIPSSAYNSYTKSGGNGKPVITWTPAEDVRFIIRSDVNAFMDVNVLAAAFNMDKADFLGHTLIVDDFGTATDCLAIMCDKSYTQFYDNLREMKQFENGSNLTWNYYYHVWQTISLSTFANAVAFIGG